MSKYNSPRPMSALVPGLTKDVFGRKNMLFGKMVAEWQQIAGTEWAAKATPIELKFSRAPKGAKTPGKAVLHLAVRPAHALEFSYQKSILIERLNMFFGYAAIKDIKIIQNSIVMNNKPRKPPQTRPLTMAETQNITGMVAGIKENDLQIALENLGKAIISRKE